MNDLSDLIYGVIGSNTVEKYSISVFRDLSGLNKLYYLTNSVAQEPECSSPHLQHSDTGPCPEPVESNPHPLSQSP
jgi:hypothetical protein